ncbi:MAG: hypothetical protein AB1469_07745 [Pseudomonadota bacterium]
MATRKKPVPKPKRPAAGARKKPEPARKGGTQERPGCPCEAAVTYDERSLAPPGRNAGNFRILIRVSSRVLCDPAAPGECLYEYIATATAQELNGPNWGASNFNGFIQSFKLDAPVTRSVKSEPVDRTSLGIAFSEAKAPAKEKIKVTIVYARSTATGTTVTLEREPELCVPKFNNPKCP